MTAAVARAAEWVFANTPIIRIFAAAYVSNPASQRVLDKAGFRFVGTMHRAFVGDVPQGFFQERGVRGRLLL